MATQTTTARDPKAILRTPRDQDLILPDKYLTNLALDELWEWYRDAANQNLDPQLVFVKIVNSVRKPYREQLSVLEQSPSGMENQFSHGSRCYTPSISECTILDEGPETPRGQRDEQIDIKIAELSQKLGNMERMYEAEKQLVIAKKELEVCNQKLGDLEKKLADSEKLFIANIPPTRIAIRSVKFDHCYVSLSGSGMLSFRNSGGGISGVQKYIDSWERFELIRHADEQEVYSFKSIAFENIYLRAESGGLKGGDWKEAGWGKVNAQYGCGRLEKFRIRRLEKGKVAIEPLHYPGTYLRLDPRCVNLQGTLSEWESFYLVYLV